MANSSQILYNTRQTLRRSEELKRIGSDMKKISDNGLGEIYGSIAANWTGTNADAYLKKLGKTQSKLSRLSGRVQAVAGSMELAARTIIAAEEAAMRIVKR